MTISDSAAQTVQALDDSVVIDSDGSEVGRVGQVYTDNETGQPTWVTVKTGWFGGRESFVPLDAAAINVGTIRVPYDKDTIKGAPHNDAGEPLSANDERELYTYYGLAESGDGDVTDMPDEHADRTRGDAGKYLTRSEEQLHVGTEKVQVGRARLRKVVVTEMQTVTVPVTREEVRLVREPVAPGDSVETSIGEAATDVVLTEERIVVSKETVPVERVRLATETVTEQREVTETVRKEQIEFDESTTDTSATTGKGRKRTEPSTGRES